MPERPPARVRKPKRSAGREVEPLDWGGDATPARALPDPAPDARPGSALTPDWSGTPASAGSAPAAPAAGAAGAASTQIAVAGSASSATPATSTVPSGAWPAGGLAPTVRDAAATVPAVRTGPSGLLLGQGTHGPVSIRLFRPTPTRVAMAVPDYVAWLLAYRCISLGAHLSIFAADQRRWSGLVDAVRDGGGTADLLGAGDTAPAAGRPYRPSVVIDDADFFDGIGTPIGPWQALLTTLDVSASSSVFGLRSCEMALVAPVNGRVQENLRRAYSLSAHQLKTCQNLADHEVALAMPRRVVTIAVPPTKLEYESLFAP